MGIYRDKLSEIILLPIIVIAQNSFDIGLSITDIAFVRYFVITDKLSRWTIFYAYSVQNFKVSELALWHE